ncbi:MAG: AAA family ATPase [Gemmatimonadetes bacterium]|nr:AAA family ATPase [Gemmatimonadota bacterium]
MKIEQIRIDGFGRLSGFDTGPKRLGSLVVVLGPNEAGKSTLFHFLTTALYGFHPAARDRSPYVPWGAEEAGGEISLRLSSGGRATVARRLRSSPSGTLTFGEDSRELRNRPLRWAEHVPRTVFRQVFAITLQELAGLDEETWASIQDRVLGSMGASDLRSAREVADTLEREAGEIWRPNRRGNQRLRDLQSEIRDLRSRRSAAVERDREIRALVEEGEGVARRLQEARAERHREKLVVERLQELLPLKRQLERIEALRRSGGPRSDLVELPDDVVGHRDSLANRGEALTREIQALDDDLREPQATIGDFDARRKVLLDQRDPIAAFVSRADLAQRDRVRLADLETRTGELEVRLAAEADRLLSTPLDGVIGETVLATSVELLRDRVERAAADRRRGDDAPTHPAANGPVTWAQLAAAGIGAAILAWGLVESVTPATVLGAAATAVAVATILQRRGTAAPPPAEEARGGITQREVEGMLANIPVRAEYLDPPAQPLVQAFEAVQATLREAGEVESQAGLLRARSEELRTEAQALAGGLGRDAGDDPIALARSLDRELREAERASDAAAAAERELVRVERLRAGLVAELAEVDDRLAEIDQRVWQLAAGAEGGKPIDVLQRRLDAHHRADRLQEELETAHPDLEARIEDIRSAEQAGVTWSVDDEDLARRKLRIEELDESIEELRGRGDALERDVIHRRDQETVDTVDSEIDSLKEEALRLTVERDKRWLLARLVREADRRFREEHQPDLLRLASGYLERLTDGRYDRLMVQEEGDGDLFQLMGPQLPAPVPLARPISTGTLEQAYLALRLAIVDHLDQGEERLPLFLDEAFVNWDASRREKGLEVVAELARTRQVFAFTCHPEMAEHLERRGACVLRLAR